MKLYLHILIFLLLMFIVIFVPINETVKVFLTLFMVAIFIGTFVWASFDINSQFFIKTICKGNSKSLVAITFDDGPDVNNTIKILEVLDDYNVKATFFIIGIKAEENPGLIRLIDKSGHTLGNHSYQHKYYFPLLPPAKIRKEFETTQKIINSITGTSTQFFRPPFGITNPLIASALKNMNIQTIGWSIRSFDTIIKHRKRIIKRINKRLNGGEIILLHDTSGDIATLLKEVLELLNRKGLKAVSLQELLKQQT